jgi:hypothetical protein
VAVAAFLVALVVQQPRARLLADSSRVPTEEAAAAVAVAVAVRVEPVGAPLPVLALLVVPD